MQNGDAAAMEALFTERASVSSLGTDYDGGDGTLSSWFQLADYPGLDLLEPMVVAGNRVTFCHEIAIRIYPTSSSSRLRSMC